VRLQVSDIVGVVGASVRGEVLAGAEVVDLVFDARKLWGLEPSGAMFLALKGRRDGHDFVGQAYAAGVRYFLVSRYEAVWEGLYAGAVFLVVEDVLVALQLMASWHRGRLSGVVMGITGSNGKTIVKEWLWELLKDDFSVGKSPRSYNSGLGVALSLLNVAAGTEVALLEAGISARGEMDVLGGMMRPNMVVLTHLGEAHAEGFGSLEEKAQEKVKLAAGADVVVYPYDQGLLRSALGALRAQQPMMKLISWGWQEGANFRLVKVEAVGSMQAISFVYRGTEHRFEIPFMDQASVSNAMSCLCALVALERWDEAHLARFRVLPRLENRLQFMAGRNGNYVLNDSYSADLESLGVALDMLKRQSPNLPMSVVLGGFEQTGMEVGALRMRLMEVVKGFGVEEVIWVGREYVGMDGLVFEDMEGLLGSAWLGGVSGRAILVKGSRSSGLERVVSRLQARLLQTRLEIHLGALKHNFLHFKRLAGEGKKVMCMVKAFGNGSGSFESARALQALAVDYLGVAYVDEGIALRNAGITVPIMVMNVDAGAAWQLQEYGLEPVVFSMESVRGLMDSGVGGLRLHVEVDTGMHRLGFTASEMEDLLGVLAGSSFRVASVFSHLAASEDGESDAFTAKQMDVFAGAAAVLEGGLGYGVLKHIENTGGILRFGDARFDMVRLGIGLYGVDPRGVVGVGLQPVTRWVSTISQVQRVKAGEGVGYGMHGVSEHDREIAVIAAGYADGLWRADGRGVSGVWVKGVEAKFVGNICMDMAMVDVTGLGCVAGDEVELFGEHLRVETVAARRGTIPYEVLTSVSQRVARVYLEE
jgi:alanine racemase